MPPRVPSGLAARLAGARLEHAALIAVVTDRASAITGAHRAWPRPRGNDWLRARRPGRCCGSPLRCLPWVRAQPIARSTLWQFFSSVERRFSVPACLSTDAGGGGCQGWPEATASAARSVLDSRRRPRHARADRGKIGGTIPLIAAAPSTPSVTPCSPPSRRGLPGAEFVGPTERRPALTAAVRGVPSPGQVGTKKRP